MATKPVQIIVISITALLLCCAGGAFLVGRGAMSSQAAAAKGATQYVDSSLPLILNSWNSKQLLNRFDTRIKQRAPDAVIQSWFALYKTKLGKVTTLRPATIQSSKYYAGTNGSSVQYILSSDATFEHASGKVVVAVNQIGNDWRISGFEIDSPALKNGASATP